MFKSSGKMRMIILMLLLVTIAAGCLINSNSFQKTYFYPLPYRASVAQYARANNLNPNLVAGVILAESKFVPQAKSPLGAIGLMQIMPQTANWIAEQTGEKEFKTTHLNDPEVNMRLGTWYLASLKQEFNSNEVLMLAAYNSGRGNVKQWMQEYKWDMAFNEPDKIPFPETRDYVKKVLKNKEHYQKLYNL